MAEQKPVTYSAPEFSMGMTPKLYIKNGATRIEHFDTITGVLRPYRTLQASTNNTGQAMSVLALSKMTLLNDSIYAVGVDASDITFGAIYQWDTTNFDWRGKMSFGAASSPNAMLHSHAGFLFGIRNSRYIYKMTTGGVYTASFYDTGAAYTNGFGDPITHSKDGKMYIPIDNKIYTIDSTGANPALALTLPNANYLIKSICEQGNYINIVGYDIKTGQSSSLVWDRDSSVVDLTETIQLGAEKVYHNAQLGTTIFFVQLREDMSNSPYQEKPVLVVKYLNGNVAETLYEFPMATLLPSRMGGKWASNDRLHFACGAKFDSGDSVRNLVFTLNAKGKLIIGLNASVDSGTNQITGVFQQGESFWITAGSDGGWDTTTSYTTTSAFETSDIRSDDLSQNIQFAEAFITCEPIPSGGSIVLKARKNNETSFTTIKTFSTADKMKLKIVALEAVNALNGLDSARQVRLRLESTGGATITGFQAIFNSISDKGNG